MTILFTNKTLGIRQWRSANLLDRFHDQWLSDFIKFLSLLIDFSLKEINWLLD